MGFLTRPPPTPPPSSGPSPVVSFRSADVFLGTTASATDVRSSIAALEARMANATTADVLRRRAVVRTPADDIVFDALVGSRGGTTSAAAARRRLDAWKEEDGPLLLTFRRDLLWARCVVVASHALLLAGQLVGVACVCRVVHDLLVART